MLLADSRMRLEPALPRYIQEVSGSSSSSTSSSPRRSNSSAKRFCWPPDSVRTGRSRLDSQDRSRVATLAVSEEGPRRRSRRSPHAANALA